MPSRAAAGPRARPVRRRGRAGAAPGRPRHELAGRRPGALPGSRRVRGLAGADPGAAGRAARRGGRRAPSGSRSPFRRATAAWSSTAGRPPASSRVRRSCRDLATLRATAHLLHAHLASAVPDRPAELDARTDQWAVAERQAYDADAAVAAAAERPEPAWPGSSTRSWPGSTTPTSGREQLVHADLAGNVLLDADRGPVRHRPLPRLALAAVGRGRLRARRGAVARRSGGGARRLADRDRRGRRCCAPRCSGCCPTSRATSPRYAALDLA